MDLVSFYEFHPGLERRCIGSIYTDNTAMTADCFVIAAKFLEGQDFLYESIRVQIPGFDNPFVVLSKQVAEAIIKSPCEGFIGISNSDEDYYTLKSYNDDIWLAFDLSEYDNFCAFVRTDR